MARIVAVHGIGQQLKGEHTLAAAWLPALRDGLKRAGGALDDDRDFTIAFYGDLFREPGLKGALPAYRPEDVVDPFERDLLATWWEEAARVDPTVPGPEACGKARTAMFVQRALAALTRSRYFGGLAERVLIGDLKQVRAYLGQEAVRIAAQERVAAAIGPDTRVLLGHSLGSVIAYEALAAHPKWAVHTLVTLGSPLGIRKLIFDRLRPPPEGGLGRWPGGVARWENIADQGDVVALTKELAALFGLRVVDHPVHNGATAHDVLPYLTAVETGRAIVTSLAG